MTTLARNLRKELENTVTKARKVAETGARKILEQLAVHHHEPWGSMTPEQRQLRNRLRAHGRQLGDQRDSVRGNQAINRLVTECAYEQWHRMLFARFLAESDLRIEPGSGMPLTLDECLELALEQSTDWLELASTFAERMLPQIFRTGDPVLEVGLPPETRSDLEDLLKALPSEVFQADDSLGWVYQFWQADRKEEVNKSGIKIGADELPAVTQLFTEDYMVYFLLHNTLGAWWAGKVLARNLDLTKTATSETELRAACAVGRIDWEYLRFVQGDDGVWKPAAGTFDGWPKAAKEIKLLDPSMGSGHFLVFSLPILVAFRMAEEGLSCKAAVEEVLRDNIYGLEIDPRCTQIAAFNLAFAAWRMVGFRALPPLHLACSGLSLGVSKVDWLKLAERVSANLPVPPDRDLFGSKDNLFSARMKAGLEGLYDLFAKAPSLGSLIDPSKAGGDLYKAGFYELEPLLAPLLVNHGGDEIEEMAVAAQGLSKAAEILADKFTLVATNVPYLGRGKQDDILKEYCEVNHKNAKADLATCFVERCLNLCSQGCSTILVTPQNWLFLGTYKDMRNDLLMHSQWDIVSRLGAKSFQTPMWDFNIVLLCFSKNIPTKSHCFLGFDVSNLTTPLQKAAKLTKTEMYFVSQSNQRNNPDSAITLEEVDCTSLLGHYAKGLAGVLNGDTNRFEGVFWEVPFFDGTWEFEQSTVSSSLHYGGREKIILWENGNGQLRSFAAEVKERLHDADRRGNEAWGKKGIVISQMGSLPATLYSGEKFDTNVAVIYPKNQDHVPAIWVYCSSNEFRNDVRRITQKLNVTNATLAKVPFDLAHWQYTAAEKYPNGLPKPFSSDPTQWLFAGHPNSSDNPLQVAVSRLLCFRWPRQTGNSFPDCPSLEPDGLEKHVDDDGIVCLNPLKGEPPAAERLNALLADAYGQDWSAAKQASLLTEVGYSGKTLDDWLRDGFFAQHCELFHQRPFIWHIWDGRRDGFHALVNYHLLAAPNGECMRTLDKLIYTYLGQGWIDSQRRDQAAGVEGADARLVAAEHLKTELEKIRNGEPPYDIFVRWKPLQQQPIGWEPDINDGVRLNIRPFMTAKPYGAKAANACILRTTPKNIKWDKDRGKEPERKKEEFPWFWGWDGQTENFAGGKEFDGNRWNDLHYTNEHKSAARERCQGGK